MSWSIRSFPNQLQELFNWKYPFYQDDVRLCCRTSSQQSAKSVCKGIPHWFHPEYIFPHLFGFGLDSRMKVSRNIMLAIRKCNSGESGVGCELLKSLFSSVCEKCSYECVVFYNAIYGRISKRKLYRVYKEAFVTAFEK